MVLFLFFVALCSAKACFGPLFNSDGSGSDVKTNVPFSTSQNFGSGGLISRWQQTFWSFPQNANGGYPTKKRDIYVNLLSGVVLVLPFNSSVCTAHAMVNPSRFTRDHLDCVPSSWSNWVGTCGEAHCDTFSIGKVNVSTIVPKEDGM
jgi:hypothetical protein